VAFGRCCSRARGTGAEGVWRGPAADRGVGGPGTGNRRSSAGMLHSAAIPAFPSSSLLKPATCNRHGAAKALPQQCAKEIAARVTVSLRALHFA
jgi:hypothetical protein